MDILSHPATVLISFSLIMVSGEHIGGVYLWYLLLALPHGGLYAILAILGAAGLLWQSKGRYLHPYIRCAAVVFLYASLFIFFYRSWDYNEGTFSEVVPLVTMAGFVLASLSLIIRGILHAGARSWQH